MLTKHPRGVERWEKSQGMKWWSGGVPVVPILRGTVAEGRECIVSIEVHGARWMRTYSGRGPVYRTMVLHVGPFAIRHLTYEEI
jgi:hypothetical protein